MNNVKKIILTGGPEGQVILIKHLRQHDPDASITWLNPQPEAFLSDSSISYLYQSTTKDLHEEIDQTRALIQEKYSVDIVQDRSILAIELDPKFVVLGCKKQIERLPFDSLLSSGNAVSMSLTIDDTQHINFCNSIDDISAIRNSVHSKPFSAIIIGSNERAIELALLLNNDQVKVTIIEQNLRFLSMYSLFTSNDIKEELEQQGIEIIFGHSVEKISPYQQGKMCTLDDGREFSCDLVISTEQFFTHPILEKAQVLSSPFGNVEVDEELATTIPSLFAFGQGIVMPTLSVAEYPWSAGKMAVFKSAAIASKNALSGSVEKERFSPIAEIRTHRIGVYHYARVGLDEMMATRNNLLDGVFVVTHFHEKNQGFTRLVFNKETKHILGAEIKTIFDPKVSINFIAFAIQMALSIEAIKKIDCLPDENIFYFLEALEKANVSKGALITAHDLASWIMQKRDFSLIDVGESAKEASIEQGQLHISLRDLEQNLSFIKAQSMPILLACEDGETSKKAYQYLVANGLEQIYILDGGRKCLAFLVASS